MEFSIRQPPAGLDWDSLMGAALDEARLAGQNGETPIGAVLATLDGQILAASRNQSIALNDPTAHAEIMCLRLAGKRLGNYRLTDTVMAVTLEPCLMCAGALIHARVSGVVFGAHDPRTGALASNLEAGSLPFSNHAFQTLGGVRAEESAQLLRDFFKKRRK